MKRKNLEPRNPPRVRVLWHYFLSKNEFACQKAGGEKVFLKIYKQVRTIKEMKKNKIKNQSEAEKEISKIIKKEVRAGNLNIESLIKRVDDGLQSQNKKVQDVIKKSILVRGSIIEMAILLENIINEILLQYYNPKNRDNFKRDILFKTLSFSQKKDILHTIIKNEKLKEKIKISSDFCPNFENLIKLRNIYAHYPEDVFDNTGKIEVSHNEFKSIKELNQKFYDLANKIYQDLHKISIFFAEKVIEDESKGESNLT